MTGKAGYKSGARRKRRLRGSQRLRRSRPDRTSPGEKRGNDPAFPPPVRGEQRKRQTLHITYLTTGPPKQASAGPLCLPTRASSEAASRTPAVSGSTSSLCEPTGRFAAAPANRQETPMSLLRILPRVLRQMAARRGVQNLDWRTNSDDMWCARARAWRLAERCHGRRISLHQAKQEV